VGPLAVTTCTWRSVVLVSFVRFKIRCDRIVGVQRDRPQELPPAAIAQVYRNVFVVHPDPRAINEPERGREIFSPMVLKKNSVLKGSFG